MRLLVVAHCDNMGHRGVEATESVFKEPFLWKGFMSMRLISLPIVFIAL